jgi:hypothetical protein
MNQIQRVLREKGFVLRPGAFLRTWLGPAWRDWDSFAASWSNLGPDHYMADGGRYRRRRYAVFTISGDQVIRDPHQPHFQATVYNRLNGGHDRWFEPVEDEIAEHPILLALMRHLADSFSCLAPLATQPLRWHAEMHQFRIEARAGMTGHPTPEGIHRDGVDGAFVMLVNRDNVSSGITKIFDSDHNPLGDFTLCDPGDAVFLDDARVFHGVTPIVPLDPDRPAIRDVLVITLTRAAG